MAADVREQTETETSLNQFEIAAEEWDNVTEITPEFQNKENINVANDDDQGVKISILVTVDIITDHLRTKPDLDTYLQQVKSCTNRRSSGNVFNNISSVKNILCCLRRPPALPPHQRQTVRLIQASALIAFSNEEPLHLSMLRTIYRQLTSTTLDCPRYGDHWEQIGFQGTDPSTDLRGVGLLGLVQATYLVTTPEILPFTCDVYNQSRVEGHEFPFMVLSLNITRIALHVLRDGLLNKHVMLEENVWNTFNFYYACLLHHVYITWKTKRLSIRDCGPLLQQTEALARSKVGSLIAQFEQFLSSKYSIAVKQSAREQILKYTSSSRDSASVVVTSNNQ